MSSEILEQQPPSDLEAEMAVIGSILLDPAVRKRVTFLLPEDFYSPANVIIYRHMTELGELDGILLRDSLRKSGEHDIVGGLVYLADCIQSVAVAAHAEHYARIVAELARKRAMVSLNLDALKALYSGKWTASELAKRQIQRLREITGEDL